MIRFLESLFSRLIITKKLLNLDKKIYEFMLWYTGKWQDWRLSENTCKQRKYSISRSFNIIYSKNSPSSTGRRWIAKNKKEHLFGNKIHGIIESVDKIIIQKKTGFMENMDHNAHSVYLMYYHLIMVVKYRRKVINDLISERAKEIWGYIAPRYGIVLEE